jgi:ADP-ribose pyrophosphatase YjhB (NUDIX family)
MKVSAQVVLINQQGLVLGVSRKNDHYDFGFIGGKMEPEDNGDAMVTAIRETLEETGLNISNLRLILAIHKDGYMSYTYLADYEGEINHNEPHVVKWLPMERLVNGSFGKYNKLVSESLKDMGVDFQYKMSIVEIENDLLLINVPGTKCATKKFEACTPAGKNKCEYDNVVVPRLNDREIAPTNMVQFK